MTDKTTLERLFRQHYRAMYRVAVTLLHDEAESKDVVSDVFARLANGVEVTEDRVATYLLAAVRNRCLNVIRNRSIRERIQRLYLLEQEVEAKSAERLCEEAQMLERGVKLLEPPVCREVVMLHFEKGMPFREIAERLEVSETTVYKYLRRAMKQLREHLNESEL